MDQDPAPPKRITAIKPTTPNSDRFVVMVDGKKTVTLLAKSITELGLGVDQPWDDRLAASATAAAQKDKTMHAALTTLNRRPLSTRQLAQKLRAKGHDPEAIEQTTERLTELGLLDDHAFGQIVIRDTLARKPAGARLLRAKLQQRGLDAQTTEALLETSTPPRDQQIAQARRLAEKTLRSASARSDQPLAVKRRLWAALARRGFDSDTIEAALNPLDLD